MKKIILGLCVVLSVGAFANEVRYDRNLHADEIKYDKWEKQFSQKDCTVVRIDAKSTFIYCDRDSFVLTYKHDLNRNLRSGLYSLSRVTNSGQLIPIELWK
jgi:hypothetical protein